MVLAPFSDVAPVDSARSDVAAIDAAFGSLPHVEAAAERAELAASSESSAAPEVTSAQRAVEVVLHTAERVATREQHAVHLRFSVGGDDLDVRVELHANEVRAIFRTESAELRAALSQEWNAAPSGAARSVTPVFTAGDANSFSNQNGDAAAQQQRDAHTRRTREDKTVAAITRARRATHSDSTDSTLPLVRPAAARASHGTSLHLHTLA